MLVDPYTFPRKYRSCLNCIHLDKPESNFGGKTTDGCRKRLLGFGLPEEKLKETYCGQWYLQQLEENY